MGWRRVHRLCALCLVPLSLGFAWLRCSLSPEFPFVSQERGAPWIMAPVPVTAALQQWGRAEAPVVSFSRRFEAAPGAAPARLALRALRHYSVVLNGEEVAADGAGADWREVAQLDLGGRLRPGANELRVDVENLRGPALLSLHLEGAAEPIRSDGSWSAAVDGRPLGAAIPADDTRTDPSALAVPTPWRALGRERDRVALLFALGVIAFSAGRRLQGERGQPPGWLPWLALAGAGAAWLVLLGNFLRIPLDVGFDARHHRAYAEFLLARRALPLATEGWSTFHPPLFYAAAAGLAALGRSADGDVPLLAFRLIPFLSGLGTLTLAWALARRLFPDRPGLAGLAAAFAAVLPVNVYVSAYFSNESLHAFLGGAALYATVACLLAERFGARRAAALGALFGLAALTKLTSLALAPLALLFLACRLAAIDRAPARRIAGSLAAFAATFAALAGWHYARSWLALGDALATNWSFSEPGRIWWQQPGFRTLAYYGDFGESLSHPFLAGFHSLWDALYSSAWGDGFVAGRVLASDRHPHWNYDLMGVGYLAALPATALIALGAGSCLRAALCDPDPRRRAAFSFLLACVWAVAFGFVYLSLQVPFASQARAPYGLVLAGPAALCFALGAARCDAALARRGWTAARAAGAGWLAVFLGTLYLSYAGP